MNQWKLVEELICLDRSKNQMKKRGKYTYQRERNESNHTREGGRERFCEGKTRLSLREEEEDARVREGQRKEEEGGSVLEPTLLSNCSISCSLT